MIKDNRISVDLGKVQYARFYYRNQHGQTKDLKPRKPTVQGMEFDPDEMHLSGLCTLIEYAIAHKLLDVWTPEVVFKVTANCKLAYDGEKAVSLWKEWQRRMFKKK